MSSIQEGSIATELFILGPRDVRVISISRPSNYAVIQFRDLDQAPSEKNTYAVTLDKLQAK